MSTASSFWCEKNASSYNHTAFPPRHLFGKYLEEQAINAQLEAESHHVKISYRVNHEVLDIKPLEGERYTVITGKGDYDVDYAILSPGHMPSSNFKHLKGQKGYVHNSWDINQFKGIEPHDDVYIIGTRLSAIDVALKLQQLNHQGQIFMASRSGLLPTVLGKEVAPYTLRYLTREKITEITNHGATPLSLTVLGDLFWKEMEPALKEDTHLSTVPTSVRDIPMIDWLRNEILEASEGSRLWQSILFALYPVTPYIWSVMEEEGKKEFMDKYHSLFIAYLAAFPLDNAHRIKNMLDTGKLKILGGLENVSHHDEMFCLKFSDKPDRNASHVINATGPGYDPSSLPLLDKMITRKLIAKHAFGGICINGKSCQVLLGNGGASPSLYAVGEVTKGHQFFTTDLGCVTAQIDCATDHLIRSLSKEKECTPYAASSMHSM